MVKMFKRKAQVQNEVFVYILAIVILSMILFFGYRAIKGFGAQSQEVSYIQLRTELQTAVKQIRSDYGSVSNREFEIPGKYKSLCFAEAGASQAVLDAGSQYTIIYDSVASGTAKNAFLYPEGTDSFDVGSIEVNIDGKKFGCIDAAGGKVKIRLEGLGDSTKISAQ